MTSASSSSSNQTEASLTRTTESETTAAYYVYLAACHDGSYYCGSTPYLIKRIEAHRNGKGAKYTASRLPVALAWHTCFTSRSEALSFEWHLKRESHQYKEQLALSQNTCLVSMAPLFVSEKEKEKKEGSPETKPADNLPKKSPSRRKSSKQNKLKSES